MTLDTQIKKAIATYIWGMGASADALATATASVEYFNGGYPDLIVKRTPMLGLSLIEDLIATATATVTSTTYTYDPDQGMIYKKSGDNWGDEGERRRFLVTYTYGFTSIPDDIQLAIDTWTNYLTADNTGARNSYRTGDDSETYTADVSVNGMPSTVKKLLAPYKRMML